MYSVTLKSGLEVTQDDSNRYHSKAWCGFPFAFHTNYGSILHHFGDKARYTYTWDFPNVNFRVAAQLAGSLGKAAKLYSL